MIPFANPSASYQAHKPEIDAAISRVLGSGIYVLGKEVSFFEEEFASHYGNNFHAIGVANGTDAIVLSLHALGLGKGDEVITTSHTAVATIAGIEQANCTPVLADIDPLSRCICPKSIAQLITEKTKAVMPVHIYGQPCAMNDIFKIAQKHKLKLIEDCSQAHGAEVQGRKVGSFGDIATFSCYPTKNLGGIGDAGVILCSSKRIESHLRSIREYGWNNLRESIVSGFNSRLDEIQASILRVKLKYLSEDLEKRKRIANLYYKNLAGFPLKLPLRNENEIHAMHLFVIECDNRDGLLNHLRREGIGASLHYPLAIHQQKAYSNRFRGSNNLEITEDFYKRHLTLPLFPELSKTDIEKIIASISSWFNQD